MEIEITEFFSHHLPTKGYITLKISGLLDDNKINGVFNLAVDTGVSGKTIKPIGLDGKMVARTTILLF